MQSIGDIIQHDRGRHEEWHEACADCGQRYQGIGFRCGPCARATRERHDSEARRRAIVTDTTIARDMLPPWQDWATFEGLDRHPGIDRTLYAAAKGWKRRAGNLLMLGPTGIGKTALAHAIARRILSTAINAKELDERDQHFACNLRWYAASKLAVARRQAPLGEGEASAVDNASRASLLVLDELGFEVSTDVTLFDVIDARYVRRAPTIVTCGRSAASLAERYGSAFVRRLVELGSVVDVHPRANS